jgi:hypothetical protein
MFVTQRAFGCVKENGESFLGIFPLLAWSLPHKTIIGHWSVELAKVVLGYYWSAPLLCNLLTLSQVLVLEDHRLLGFQCSVSSTQHPWIVSSLYMSARMLLSLQIIEPDSWDRVIEIFWFPRALQILKCVHTYTVHSCHWMLYSCKTTTKCIVLARLIRSPTKT